MDPKDFHHKNALEIKKYIDDENETTVINTTVIVETLNRAVGMENNIENFYDNLKDENIVVQLTEKDYLKSLEINGWFGNSINYSDCTIINTMMDLSIDRIVSFDSGFKKIGIYEVISTM